MIAFLIDEPLPRHWRRALARQTPESKFWRIGDLIAPPFGSSDALILDWCETHVCHLLTDDRKSLWRNLDDRLTRGKKVPGIFLADPMTNVEKLAQHLELIAGTSVENEYRNRIVYLAIT